MKDGFIEGKAMITSRIHPLNNYITVPPPPKCLFRKKVSFEADATAIPTPSHSSERSDEDIKTRWYSKRELAVGCREAKQTVALINSVNGDWNTIDHSQICIVGLEKFHGKKERDANKKLLIKSVLIRQEMNKNLGLIQETNGLREISTMISASFKEYARWQAAMHMVHAYGKQQPSSYASPPPPPPPPTQSSMNCNNKRLRIDITQTKTPAVPVNNTPKPLMQTLEGCTNTKRIKTYR